MELKLYLSSYRLGDHPEKLIELLSQNKKTAVIANSMDFLEGAERNESVQRETEDLTRLGLLPEELDLRDYFGRKEELNKRIIEYGLLWVRGGNTFILIRAIAQSGFDEILKEKRNDSSFVYAGYSAGVCVITPTLHGLEIVDDPNIIPVGYKPEIIWNGLNIIDYSIAPHYKSDHPESASVDKTVEYFKKHKMPFKTLRDGEVIIVQK